MIPILRKNVAFLFANCALYRGISRSLSLRLLSTSEEGKFVVSPEIFDLLLNKYQFSLEVATKVASFPNRVKDPAKSDSILSFLSENGFSNSQLEKLLKSRPRYLAASLEDTIKPRLKVLQDFGLCSDDIAKIISSNAGILELKPDTRVIPSFSMLKGLLGTNDAVAKLLKKSAWFLHKDLERTVVPNIEFLKSCSIPTERILKLLCTSPRVLLLKPEVIRNRVAKAVEMGADRHSNMFIFAVRTLSSHSEKAWELKLQAFRNIGFSESEIMTMFKKEPKVFNLSSERLKRSIDCFLATGKYKLSCIVEFPISLCSSIEKRYKPRFQVLEILESKNLIKKWPAIARVRTMTDEKFFEKFVGPHLSEIGGVYIAKSSATAKRENKLNAVA